MYTSDWTVLYLMSLLNSFLHHCTSRQPGGVIKIQAIQELLTDCLHSLPETLLVKTGANTCRIMSDTEEECERYTVETQVFADFVWMKRRTHCLWFEFLMIICMFHHYTATTEFQYSAMWNTLSETVCQKRWDNEVLSNHLPNDPCSPASSASCHVLHKLQSDLALSSSYECEEEKHLYHQLYHEHLHTKTHIWLKYPWV